MFEPLLEWQLSCRRFFIFSVLILNVMLGTDSVNLFLQDVKLLSQNYGKILFSLGLVVVFVNKPVHMVVSVTVGLVDFKVEQL